MAIEPLAIRRAKKLAATQARSERRALNMQAFDKSFKAQSIRHVRSGMIGFTLRWCDINPLGETGEGELSISNTNPKQFNCAQEMWDHLERRKWIVESVFTWVAELELVFDLPNSRTAKKERIDKYEFRYTGRLRDPVKGEDTPLNNEIERKIMAELFINGQRPDGEKNKGIFRIANYKVVCVGI